MVVDKTKIQEKLSAGTLSGTNTASILASKKIKGLKGDRGITLTGDDDQVTIKGPPVSDWTSGITTETHNIDTGPTKLVIRNASIPSQTVAEFENASKKIMTYGDLHIDPQKTIFTDSIAAHLGTDGQHRIKVNGGVWFDAAPQDITFEATGTSYTLQEAFDSKQDSSVP